MRSPRPICAGVVWEPPAALEARAAHLLPGLFLARVDGKSPVEYITAEPDKDRVRRTARALLAAPVGPARRRARRPGRRELARMTDTAIAFVHGRRVWDSRGRPTVEADVLLEGGGVGRAIAPGRRLHRHRRGARPARRRRRRSAATT